MASNLGTLNFIAILGMAVSGLALYVSFYDWVSGIQKELRRCEQSDALKRKIQNRFIITMVIFSVLAVLGFVLVWKFTGKPTATMGLVGIGLLGVLYGLAEKFQDTSAVIRGFSAFVALIAFTGMAFFLDRGREV